MFLKSILSLALLSWGAFSHGLHLEHEVVCYEYVTVITYVGAQPSKAQPSKAQYVTITEPYTGTSPIPGPITLTVPPTNEEKGTIIVQTPTTKPSIPGYVIITIEHKGKPTTETIPPTKGSLGTIVIETPHHVIPTEPSQTSASSKPPSSSNEKTTFPPPSTISSDPPVEPSTSESESSEPSSTTTSSVSPTTTIVDPPGPTFSCDRGGYLIQKTTLYRLNLATGENPVVKDQVGPGGNINALGYNIKDNFLYGFMTRNGMQELIRIDAKGGATVMPLKVESGLTAADIDDKGQMWASARGYRWIKVDLDPDSDTYAQKVDEGSSTGAAGQIADWVYLKNGGRFLYSIAIGDTAVAVKWDMDTHEYTVLRDYGEVVPDHSGFGALYAVEDEVWGSDNQTGDIIAFPMLSDSAPARKITDGPTTSSNDGARCFKAPHPSVQKPL